jgi:hypothetical protein
MAELVWFDEDHRIEVPFETDGYELYRGGRGLLGTPPEASWRLVGVRSGRAEVLDVPDLEGRVTIRSPADALAFVRLFTSLDTHFLFPGVGYVESRPAAGERRGPGEYTPDYASRVALSAPRFADRGDSFLVERNLLLADGPLVRSRELVGRDGSYRLEHVTPVDDHPPIVYPAYE